jgi:site-specific DNA recombinase
MAPNFMRCAIYARYSSDQQSPASIDDQIRNCREHAGTQGWIVLEECIYTDAEISGAGSDRPGLRRLVDMAARKPRPFDVLLVDDTSRLSRRMADAMDFFDKLRFADIRIVAVSQGIDSQSEQADTLITVHGLVDSLYIKELGKKTHRGLEGRALKGLHTGGRVFGYRSEQVDGGGVRLVVDETEAVVVRRIFTMYAAGTSLKNVAKTLNKDKVPTPRARSGRTNGTWCPSAIREMLRNEIYVGLLIWNRAHFVKKPGTNKRVRRERPRKDWKVASRPELRIIGEDLWRATLARRDLVAKLFAKPGGGTRKTGGPYLLSGFLKCGACGGNLIIVAGRGKKTIRKYYGCAQHFHRGTCPNGATLRQDLIEKSFFAEMQKLVLGAKAVDHVLAQVSKRVREAKRQVSAEVAGLNKRRDEIQRELVRLTDAVARTGGSTAVLDAIVAREEEREEINSRMAAAGKAGFEERVDGLRDFVTSRLSNIRDLLAADPARSRAELAKHATPIKMVPGKDGVYTAEGKWDLFGSDFEVVAGGGFEPPTFGL